MITETEKINKIIEINAKKALSNKEFLAREIEKWKSSPKRKLMITGEKYYHGEHDILKKERTVIGENGELVKVNNLPNNKIVNNQYAKMVDQKVNYLLGQPLTFDIENENYAKLLKEIFNKRFQRMFKNLGQDVLNHGIAWLYPYYDEFGNLQFKRIPGYEILPFWKDSDHTILEMAVRLYTVEAYDGENEIILEKVEVFHSEGIDRYILLDGELIPDGTDYTSSYITLENDEEEKQGLNWAKIPLIAFKYNNKEIPLIKKTKSLQDGINTILSNFQDNMEEDTRNTILVLVNYEGTNLGEFRRNLAEYGAVKVTSVEGISGDVKTLTVEVNHENYKAILDVFKRALIENAMGYDAKDTRLSGNPNQMNILSMYSDIDLDANGIETEFQAAFEELFWFVNVYLVNRGKGDFTDEPVTVIFNRDIMMNENEIIDSCQKSMGILSHETIIGQHPWVSDVEQEMERIRKEKEQELNSLYGQAFQNSVTGDDDEE